MNKAALEALVNTYLAPLQPITANGMHKPSMQKVMDEMYDAQSRGDVLKDVATSVSLVAGDLIFLIRGGQAVLVDKDLFSVGGSATSITVYATTAALLVNTTIVNPSFAYVEDATAHLGSGWGLYLYVGGDRAVQATYKLIAKQQPDGIVILIDEAFVATGDVYKSTGGTGTAGAIEKGNQYIVSGPGSALFPIGAVCTAKINNPGQTRANWHINQGGE